MDLQELETLLRLRFDNTNSAQPLIETLRDMESVVKRYWPSCGDDSEVLNIGTLRMQSKITLEGKRIRATVGTQESIFRVQLVPTGFDFEEMVGED